MKTYLAGCLLLLFSSCEKETVSQAPTSEKLIESYLSWNGDSLPAYPEGKPKISIVKVTIPPHSELPKHYHPVINAGILLKGELTVVDEKGNIKRLSTESIKFEIEGEGTLLGGSESFLNPRPAIWGTAPMLVQSTTKAGKITVRASVSINTTQKPVSGELIINSIANQTPAIYSEKELALINQIKAESNGINGQIKKPELELEIQKLKKELNDIKLKEVEKEQNKFGKGLN